MPPRLAISEWMTQRAIASLLGTSVANVNIHLASLKTQGYPVGEWIELTDSHEGRRILKRKLRKYPISTVYAISVKAHRFVTAEAIRRWAKQRKLKTNWVLVHRPEANFATLLSCLQDLVKIIPQYRIGGRSVDFFIPDRHLAIEYDEFAHERSGLEDGERQRHLESKYNIEFVRVKQGHEVDGLRRIINRLFLSDGQKSNGT
ncbi:MAG TPA: hypothetical protein VG897_11090 [Terriglobales bacterium]|jgi:very-short-patch-repair endonuclease|nr:hypothetical protein [Terriglobales bacterium]